MQSGVAERLERLDPPLEPGDAPDGVQRDERERQQARDDDEELEHLVVDRRGEAAEGDVDEHERGGDEDRGRDRPPEHQVDDEREREQVDAGDEHRRDGERAGVEGMGELAEPQSQVLRYRADLGAVVERHHHEAEEDHRRHRPDPVVVDGGDAVLGAVGGLAEDLECTEVGGDEREARDPGRERPAGEEEVDVGLDEQARDEADAEHDDEVDPEDHIIDRARV